MRRAAILIFAAYVLWASANAIAQVQPGSSGGTLGKTDKSIGGERETAAPAKHASQPKKTDTGAATVSAIGQWNWEAQCSGTGHWKGGFFVKTDAGGAISGDFNEGHPGTFTGSIAGNRVAFTRTSVWGAQWWSAVFAQGDKSMQGTFSDPMNGNCTFQAVHP